MEAKVGTFSVQIIKALCCYPTFLAGNSSLGVNTPSSSGNVDELLKTFGETTQITLILFYCLILFPLNGQLTTEAF
jgi:hypothetical protein